MSERNVEAELLYCVDKLCEHYNCIVKRIKCTKVPYWMDRLMDTYQDVLDVREAELRMKDPKDKLVSWKKAKLKVRKRNG